MAAIHPARATLKYSALVLAALGLVQPAARAGLVGHWALDETGGTTAACDVNVTYNGTIAGATIDQSGKIGKAFGFGGSGYVDVNAAPWSGTMTVSAWINTTTGADMMIVGWSVDAVGGGTDPGPFSYQHFKINPSGKLLYQPVGAVTGTIAQSSGSVNNGQWRQVVAVLNSPTVQLYIDGAPDGSGTLGGSMTTLHTKLGAMQALGNPLYQPYTGLMDDVAVWNTALTAGKVRSLSTITTVLGDYSASKMDKLFQVYDGTLGSYNDGTRTWQKVTGLTEHGAGDAWTDGSTCYVQFDAAGAGVRGTSGAPVVATKLAITSVNGGVSPIAGTAFSVVVQGQDAGGTPGGVTAATAVSLSLKTGTGTLGGMLSGTIAAGASVVTISGATYSKAESGVVLTATRTSGDNLTAGDSGAFAVNSPPPPTATITLSKPTGRAIYQRNNDNLANVQIKGTYTGSADGVEARAVTRVGYGGTTTAWTAIAAAVGQFDGTLSVTGGWYDVDVRTVLGGVQTGISTVQRVGAGEVFITAGQSNSANYGSPQQSPADDRVSAYNLGTASWQLANDPQPAAGGSGGSPWPHLGDLLAARSAVPIGIVAVGVGGTKVIQWQPGTTFYDYILAAINGLKSTGGCRAILWHQGESDSNPPTGMDPNSSWDEVYATNLENVIAQSRTDAGFTVPWGVAIASWNGTGEANYAHVTNGQHLVIDHYPAVFLGSQTDIFHSDNLPYLSDGIHFNQQGLDAHGQQWADALFAANIIVGSSIVADAGTSTVVASPAMVANDGVSTSTITVTLKDANSNPVGGKSVTLASSRGACDTISAASGPSNGSGVVTFTVRSATAGLAEFTATDTTDAPGVVIATPATVTFYAVSLGHMIGHWALDETGGTTAACDVNAHYDGAIAGATIDQSGKIGKAFGFGGSGYVDVNAAPWSGTMTVSAWINTTTGADMMIVGWSVDAVGGGTDPGPFSYQHFKINPSGKLLYQPVGAVTGTIAQSSGSVNNGQWRQVVAVLNSPTVNLYIDGAPDGSGTLGGSMTSLHTEFGSMRAFGNPLYQPYTGLMDDVAVWNTALTAGKVRSLSTITAVLGDYSASKMDKLFQVYDGTLGSYNDGTRTWQKVTGLTEHSAGEAWTDGSTCHVQFDAAGAGVSSSGGSAYASWAATNGASGQTLAQDHDHDGVANGIEYFLGGPNGNTTGFTPLPGVVNTAGTRSVTWTHAADYAGVHGTDYVVQTSATLADGSWTDETLGVTVTISGNHLTYTFPAGDERTFARLMVTGP